MKYTSNYGLKKPEGTDIVNIDDLNYNADILDQKLKEVEDKANNAPPNSVNDAAIGSRTPDQTQAPASPGTGTLTQLVSWLANRIKTITGKTNWWDEPPTTLQAAKAHMDAAAPHSGHETPSGAQTKANAAEANAKSYTDTHAGTKNTHGVGSGYYIAKTSRSDQLPAWNEVQGKPSNFTPSAHKSTHASGGSDALTPSDIGAETPSGAQEKANAALNSAKQYADQEVAEVSQELAAHKAEKATENTLGHVMVDGDTITITPNGVIRAEGSRFNPDLSYVRIGQNATTTTETDISIGSNALSNGISKTSGKHFGAIAIGAHSEGRNAPSIAIGSEALASGNTSIALGYSASAVENASIALGWEASTAGECAVALGRLASATEDYSVALGYYASANNANEGILGGTGSSRTSKWKVPGSFTVSGTKNFEIPHPKPGKSATHVIRHGAVESPTPGDTLYRWKVQATKDNDLVTIDLPDYFIYLNKDVQIWVTGQGHFGNGYGTLNRETEQLEIHCQLAGEYNVLVIGTRNDDHPSVQEWYIKGVEREIGESWTGETYAFSVDEIIEIEEIKEVSA